MSRAEQSRAEQSRAEQSRAEVINTLFLVYPKTLSITEIGGVF